MSGMSTGEELSIEVGDKLKTVIRSSGSRFMNWTSADEFPTVKTLEHNPTDVVVDAADLVGRSGRCAVTSTDEARYNLNGLLLAPMMNQTVVVATDGHRLAKTTGPGVIGLGSKTEAIVPREGVGRILDYLAGISECVIQVDKDAVHLTRPSCSLSVRLTDGAFPAYEKVIPTAAPDGTVEVERDALASAVKRVLLVSTDRRVVKLDVGTNELFVAASPEFGEASDVVVPIVAL